MSALSGYDARFAVAVLVLLIGCSSEARTLPRSLTAGRESPTPQTVPAPTAEVRDLIEFSDRVLDAQCEHFTRCFLEDRWITMMLVARACHPRFRGFTTWRLRALVELAEQGRAVLDPRAAEQCLEDYGTGDCSTAFNQSCPRAFVPRAEAGVPRNQAVEPRPPGVRCDPAADGRCADRPSLGSPCAGVCAGNLICVSQTAGPRCVERGSASCSTELPCAPGRLCVENVCRAVARANEPCGREAPCTPGFTCLEGTCRAQPVAGDECDGRVPCLEGSCQARRCVLLGPGQPCSLPDSALLGSCQSGPCVSGLGPSPQCQRL